MAHRQSSRRRTAWNRIPIHAAMRSRHGVCIFSARSSRDRRSRSRRRGLKMIVGLRCVSRLQTTSIAIRMAPSVKNRRRIVMVFVRSMPGSRTAATQSSCRLRKTVRQCRAARQRGFSFRQMSSARLERNNGNRCVFLVAAGTAPGHAGSAVPRVADQLPVALAHGPLRVLPVANMPVQHVVRAGRIAGLQHGHEALFPSMAGCNSFTPASSATVGSQSQPCAIWPRTTPSGRWPGHDMMAGSRIAALEQAELRAAIRPPRCHRRSGARSSVEWPLSDWNTTMVRSRSFTSSPRQCNSAPIRSSIVARNAA